MKTRKKALFAIPLALIMSCIIGTASVSAAETIRVNQYFDDSDSYSTNATTTYTTTLHKGQSNQKTYATYKARNNTYAGRFKRLIVKSYFVGATTEAEWASEYVSGTNLQYDKFIEIGSSNNLLVIGGINTTSAANSTVEEYSVRIVKKATTSRTLPRSYYAYYADYE